MSIRVVLLGSISFIAISASALATTTGCNDDRFACEPQAAAEQPAAPLSLQPAAAARNKTAARRVHRAAKHAHASRKSARSVARATVRARMAAQDQEKAPPEPNEFDKAPPENVLPQGTMSWMPADAPSSKATPFEAFNALAAKPAKAASGDVRVVPADEVNEIDLSAPQMPASPAAVQAEAAPAPVIENAVIEKPAKPADTALLDRIFITFGGAFGAASAMRLFLKA